MTWPCRCEMCAPPLDSCDACAAPAGELCRDDCSEHPRHKMPCHAMSLVGRLSALGVLLRNLRDAGAMCASYNTGATAQYIDSRKHWRPGCGRAPRPDEQIEQ